MARKTKADLESDLKRANYIIGEQMAEITELQNQIKTGGIVTAQEHQALAAVAQRQEKQIASLLKMLDDQRETISKLRTELDKVRTETPQTPRKHNERGAGRKRNAHLEVYLLNCWAKEMRDCEIIGTEYDGFSGKETVNAPSYYRYKRWLKGKKDM